MNYKILKPINLNEIIPFTEDFKTENIIIDLLEIEVSLAKIKSFQEIVIKKNNSSFVIINNNIDIDQLPDEINLVRTLQEAIDVIEMDEMMRELE